MPFDSDHWCQMNEVEQITKLAHFLIRVLERKVKRRVIQPMVQINRDFSAFCLLLPDCLRIFSTERRQALLNDLFCAASSLHAENTMLRVCAQSMIPVSASFLRWKASWIISFFSFFSKIYYCSSLIIRSFSSTLEACTSSCLACSRTTFSGLWREFMRLAMLTRLPVNGELAGGLVSDQPQRDSGMRSRRA